MDQVLTVLGITRDQLEMAGVIAFLTIPFIVMIRVVGWRPVLGLLLFVMFLGFVSADGRDT